MTRGISVGMCVTASALLFIAAPPAGGQAQAGTSIASVMARSAQYVSDFNRRLSGIVVSEDYIQDVDAYTFMKPAVTHRELKSDLLLVRPADGDRFVEFRDVAEVDGRSVRDRQERLTQLFLDPNAASGQLQKIIAESARYNIGQIVRTVNTPVLPLMFLDPVNQPRFRFSVSTDRSPSLFKQGRAGAAAQNAIASSDLWVIEYRESRSRTMIRTPAGGDMLARGRFWIDPVSGRVLLSELMVDDTTVRATIDVSYQSEPRMGFFVPAEMQERYDAPNLVITGTATYRDFRSFNVQVEEAPK